MKAALVRALLLSSTASALIGYPITSKCLPYLCRIALICPVYDPDCAFACRDIFASAMLTCSGHDHSAGAHSHGQGASSPECYASDSSWLTTVANCINATCADAAPWKLEKFWSERITGRFTGVKPKWTYQETLVHMQGSGRPTRLLEGDEVLDFTADFDEKTWESTRGALEYFGIAEKTHSKHG